MWFVKCQSKWGGILQVLKLLSSKCLTGLTQPLEGQTQHSQGKWFSKAANKYLKFEHAGYRSAVAQNRGRAASPAPLSRLQVRLQSLPVQEPVPAVREGRRAARSCADGLAVQTEVLTRVLSPADPSEAPGAAGGRLLVPAHHPADVPAERDPAGAPALGLNVHSMTPATSPIGAAGRLRAPGVLTVCACARSSHSSSLYSMHM